jgi:opacity protein-like surface antigen
MVRFVGINAGPLRILVWPHKGLKAMSNLKILAVAGFVLSGAASVASAADLGHPRPAGLPPIPVAAPIGETTGWYLRADIGIAYQNSNPEIVDNRFTPTTVGLHNFSMSNPGFVGIGAGYQFNSWLRGDITGEYRLQSRFGFTDNYCFGDNGGLPVATPGIACSVGPAFTGQDSRNFYTGRVASLLFLANAYVDLGTWSGFTPFLGAGIGFAQHKFSNLVDTGISDNYFLGVNVGTSGVAPTTFADKTTSNFAWALMAGVAYDLSPAYKIEVAYRYLNMGKGSQSLACGGPTCGDSINYKDIDAHEFKIGLRWMLGGPAYAPVPTDLPPEPRLVKKY